MSAELKIYINIGFVFWPWADKIPKIDFIQTVFCEIVKDVLQSYKYVFVFSGLAFPEFYFIIEACQKTHFVVSVFDQSVERTLGRHY